MTSKMRWMRMAVSGLLLAGCGGPMDPAQEQDAHAGTVSASTSTETPPTTPSSTPPPVVELTASTNLREIWPRDTSVRRYVVLVAYTLPPDDTGVTPPPRFRALGVDIGARGYVFQLDGDRRTYMASFMEAMFRNDTIIISTPPGLRFDGKCSLLPPVITTGADGQVTASADEADCGTEPVIRSTGSNGTGGNDWQFDWMRVLDIPFTLNTTFTDAQFHGFAGASAMGVPEAHQER
ncbi:hypothetical protein P2318_18025 [Myxococcaceae bacterium GXIMD 01537]